MRYNPDDDTFYDDNGRVQEKRKNPTAVLALGAFTAALFLVIYFILEAI